MRGHTHMRPRLGRVLLGVELSGVEMGSKNANSKMTPIARVFPSTNQRLQSHFSGQFPEKQRLLVVITIHLRKTIFLMFGF